MKVLCCKLILNSMYVFCNVFYKKSSFCHILELINDKINIKLFRRLPISDVFYRQVGPFRPISGRLFVSKIRSNFAPLKL